MSDPFRTGAPEKPDKDLLSELTAFAGALADASRAVITPLFRAQYKTEHKPGRGFYDPVTEADRAAEAAIRALIEKQYPDHGTYGEEYGYQEGASGFTWVIDPIDGTRAFLTGKPTWGTLIALHNGARPLLGIMDQPYTEERYVGVPDLKLATLTDRRGKRNLACRETTVADALLSTTHPSMFSSEPEKSKFENVSQAVRMVAYGGDCYNYAVLALGAMDVVIETQLKVYDIQAMIPIVEAAGGQVTDWQGGPADLGGKVLATGCAQVHEELLALLG